MHTISNGSTRGSSRLTGRFEYSYLAVGVNSSQVDIETAVFMSGVSERRHKRRWRRKRTSHGFGWGFQVNHTVKNGDEVISSETIRLYGRASHWDNQVAIERIYIVDSVEDISFAFNNFYTLDRIYPGYNLNGHQNAFHGTFQRIDLLPGAFIIYDCQQENTGAAQIVALTFFSTTLRCLFSSACLADAKSDRLKLTLRVTRDNLGYTRKYFKKPNNDLYRKKMQTLIPFVIPFANEHLCTRSDELWY